MKPESIVRKEKKTLRCAVQPCVLEFEKGDSTKHTIGGTHRYPVWSSQKNKGKRKNNKEEKTDRNKIAQKIWASTMVANVEGTTYLKGTLAPTRMDRQVPARGRFGDNIRTT